MRFVTVRCPNCGAQIKVEEGRVFAVCESCASQVMIDPDKMRNPARGAESMEGLQREMQGNAGQITPAASQAFGNDAAAQPFGNVAAAAPAWSDPTQARPQTENDRNIKQGAPAQPFDHQRAQSAGARVRSRAAVPPPYETKTRFQSSDGRSTYSVEEARNQARGQNPFLYMQERRNAVQRRRKKSSALVFLVMFACVAFIGSIAAGLVSSYEENRRYEQTYDYDWEEPISPEDEEVWEGEDWAYIDESYLQSLTDISEEQSARLDRNSRNELKKYFAEQKDWGLLSRDYDTIEHAGRYLLLSKNSDEYEQNLLYDVYQVTFPANLDDAGNPIGQDETVYVTVVYDNLEVNEDGSLRLADSYARVDGDSVWIGRREAGNDGMIDGYRDEESMFNGVINRNTDSYEYEISEELTDFLAEEGN